MKEKDIRKRDTLNNYLEMVEQDIKKLFIFSTFVKTPCPACANSDRITEGLKKKGFTYVLCQRCATLFVNPRPTVKELKDFYADSPSALFWIDKFFGPVAEMRREKMFRPRAEYVNTMFPEKANGFIVDVGSGFGIFLEELSSLWPTTRFMAVEPSPRQAEICRGKGLDVQCCTIEELEGFDGQVDLLTAFELIEHLFSPEDFLRRVRELLKPTGHLLMTTLNGQGFDIQLLWERSKSINPPHHLNFFNPQSVVLLLKHCGFEIVEVSTPGELDWDIVEGMIKNEKFYSGRFWDFFSRYGTLESKQELQDWISRNNLSSHMRIIAKPNMGLK